MNKENSNNILKAGIWYTISAILTKSISFITIPIFTRIMTVSDYGIVSTFNSWASLLVVLTSLNLSYSVGRAKIDYGENLGQYIGSMQVLSVITSGIAAIIMVVFIDTLSNLMALSKVLIFTLCIYLLFEPAINYEQIGYRYRYQYKQNIAISVYISITNILLSLVLVVLYKHNKYMGRILGSVIPIVALSLFFWIKAAYGKRLCINPEYWKYGLLLSIPLIFHKLSLSILSQSDRILISKYCGNNWTGVYSVVYQYGTILSIITNAIAEAWLPWFHDSMKEQCIDKLKVNTYELVNLICLLGLGCIAAGPEAILILGGKNYVIGKWIVPPVVMAVVTQHIYTHYVNIEMHLKKTTIIAFGTALAAIVNIILNVIYIPQYGYIAAAYTTLVGYMLLLLMHFMITRFRLHQRIYDDKRMFIQWGFFLGASVSYLFIYGCGWVARYMYFMIFLLFYAFKIRKKWNIVEDFFKR